MPCEKCKDGGWKWGKTGACEYETRAECEAANKDYYENKIMGRPRPHFYINNINDAPHSQLQSIIHLYKILYIYL